MLTSGGDWIHGTHQEDIRRSFWIETRHRDAGSHSREMLLSASFCSISFILAFTFSLVALRRTVRLLDSVEPGGFDPDRPLPPPLELDFYVNHDKQRCIELLGEGRGIGDEHTQRFKTDTA
mmetsp:Transcript_28645/g.69550  ORF Transcript_28645/g.69550 Transcript_28645/m.69550 type:complete len:121 (-) Transcript_28645:10-372(-)